jgi:hypothetical protein
MDREHLAVVAEEIKATYDELIALGLLPEEALLLTPLVLDRVKSLENA